MTCRDLIEFLDDYVADDLPAASRSEFDRHLAVCPECRDYLKTYRETISLAKGVHDDGVPTGVPDELVKAILAARRRAR